jgi:hypothetical protein
VWGHFHTRPVEVVYPQLPAELIYAGETKNLNSRLLGPRRHHRLIHYRATFPSDTELKRLYLSVFRVDTYRRGERSRALRAFTRYVEDRIYWEYVQAFGQRTALNYAAKSGTIQIPAPCCSPRV